MNKMRIALLEKYLIDENITHILCNYKTSKLVIKKYGKSNKIVVIDIDKDGIGAKDNAYALITK